MNNELLVGKIKIQGRRDWRTAMLTSIMVSLFMLWLLGIATSTTLGGSIHVLLVLAAMIVILNLVRVSTGLRVL